MSHRFIRSILLFVLVVGLAPTALHAQYDILIRGARLLDGTGNPWYYADVAVTEDRIAAVGRLEGATARSVLDARGLYLAPGFIDVHTHAANGLTTAELSSAHPLLAQGLTTVIVNPDGGGPVDVARQRRALEEHGLGVNVAQLIPHNSIRRQVLGMEDRAPSADELQRMKALVRAGMEEGAFGLSTGLFSAPGNYAETEEVIELARVVAEYQGTYASHIRDESDYSVGVVAAVEEVISVAREAKLRGLVTHIKALGPRVWGFSSALISRIERAREQGVEVFADQYPYTASATSLVAALVPRWAEVGGREQLLRRMRDPQVRPRLAADMEENLDRRGGASRIQFRRYEPDPSIEGRTLQQVAEQQSQGPIDAAITLITAGNPAIVSFNMHEDDVATLMRRPWVMTCTDGGLGPMGEGVPHPRTYGAFPHKIRSYVVDEQVISLAAAIRSMTGLPATVFRIRDRGFVRPGALADLVVFDLDQVRDRGTYQEPHQLSEGMVHILVNGVLAVQDGQFTDRTAGRVLALQE
jgi:N-acyl-D-aspartate/D-glutamate deacylase